MGATAPTRSGHRCHRWSYLSPPRQVCRGYGKDYLNRYLQECGSPISSARGNSTGFARLFWTNVLVRLLLHTCKAAVVAFGGHAHIRERQNAPAGHPSAEHTTGSAPGM